MWIDDTPKRPDTSTVGTVDIRHSEEIEYEQMQRYHHLKPKAYIHHVLTFPHGKKFMAALTTIGSGSNSKTFRDRDLAKRELDLFVDEFINKMQNYGN
ncbi:hypothetical protein NIES2100_05060 [Calothrix sp. NIES-2100]|uniref:hypothetical protein n=1 Tax=Calothrix sp. NIES-2100 TaxID=1954172 RepID=UPI000B5F3469|nr:hypothetical protein NIES2100_05060 [Calothrix sp. NIES-2100]